MSFSTSAPSSRCSLCLSVCERSPRTVRASTFSSSGGLQIISSSPTRSADQIDARCVTLFEASRIPCPFRARRPRRCDGALDLIRFTAGKAPRRPRRPSIILLWTRAPLPQLLQHRTQPANCIQKPLFLTCPSTAKSARKIFECARAQICTPARISGWQERSPAAFGTRSSAGGRRRGVTGRKEERGAIDGAGAPDQEVMYWRHAAASQKTRWAIALPRFAGPSRDLAVAK
ncbi:hypothetical protein BV20DRAFT_784669 [Pilatotrama ljubarskyi]|nr:hypothetical protein BV20DRAFT_784669 [Pilatotrama ljubarskyi]